MGSREKEPIAIAVAADKAIEVSKLVRGEALDIPWVNVYRLLERKNQLKSVLH